MTAVISIGTETEHECHKQKILGNSIMNSEVKDGMTAAMAADNGWITDMVPQKEPMRFIDGVEHVDIENRTVICSFTPGVRPCAGFSEEKGGMPALCLIETMAQSIAALMIAEEGKSGKGFKIGFILSVRKMAFYGESILPAGLSVLSTARITFEDDAGVCMAETEVAEAVSGKKLAEARITVMKPNDAHIARMFG